MTRRAAWTGVASAAVLIMLVPSVTQPHPDLLWNATASTPVGLYRLQAANVLHDGELVAVMPPPSVASFLARGGFLPRGVPLLKHLGALAGQTVCRAGDVITIDGIAFGVAHDLDSRGRPLPRWRGCRTLRKGEIFLMNSSVPDSLDGRYFGPLPAASIIGQATPLWLAPHPDGAVTALGAAARLPHHPTERTTP